MEYIIVAFRSRTHTLNFSDLLKRNFIKHEIVSTPKEAGVGCGLSVKIDKGYFSVIKKAVNALSLSSFAGYFLVTVYMDKRIVRSI